MRVKEKWEAPRSWAEQLAVRNRPVVEVSWYEARAYCRWLSRQWRNEGEVRLPTNEEREQAASPDKRKYPWGNEEPDPERANFGEHVNHPTPVGIYPMGNGAFGHGDLAGNVWEWSADGGQGLRGLRGGAWVEPPEFLAAGVSQRQRPGARQRRRRLSRRPRPREPVTLGG